jgi:hypothetical protein
LVAFKQKKSLVCPDFSPTQLTVFISNFKSTPAPITTPVIFILPFQVI